VPSFSQYRWQRSMRHWSVHPDIWRWKLEFRFNSSVKLQLIDGRRMHYRLQKKSIRQKLWQKTLSSGILKCPNKIFICLHKIWLFIGTGNLLFRFTMKSSTVSELSSWILKMKVRFQVLTAASAKMKVFWDVAPFHRSINFHETTRHNIPDDSHLHWKWNLTP
jgi:hypothetical protein